ncbi:Pyruvate kinase [Corchorus olitorius]|uniref:pyruvate kinase n=1 Tax=Corchorus olitorius TaxID=93759 RepID=A0A1R3FW48_9ROSI|nr:Pyruvate kinase [Corchorus olitorius]
MEKIQGLKAAVKDRLPTAEHRNCARHVFSNWGGRRLPKTYEFAYWNIVKATTPREWDDRFAELDRIDNKKRRELMKKKPKYWTRAFQNEVCKCDMVDNNACESFNSILLDARTKSIIAMLEQIREETMKRILAKRKFVEKWKDNYGPLIKIKFDQRKKDSGGWELRDFAENGVEIKKGRDMFIVNLNMRTCSCRYWQISGIPCCHACCAIWINGGNPDDFLSHYYSRETYARAYQYSLNPINGPNGWKKTGREELLPPLQPKAKRGRPKKNRRKAPDELTSKNGKMSKTGLPQKCGTCREEGHNKSTCPNKDRVPTVQATVPKKRGRPPKDKDKTNNDNGEAAVPKRRGRPPKDKGIFGNQALDAVDNGDHAEKRRGRPETSVGKTSSRGYGNYFSEKTGKMTFYGEYRPNKRNQASSSTSQAIRSSHTTKKSTMTTSTKRKSHDANPIGTQESVKRKNEFACELYSSTCRILAESGTRYPHSPPSDIHPRPFCFPFCLPSSLQRRSAATAERNTASKSGTKERFFSSAKSQAIHTADVSELGLCTLRVKFAYLPCRLNVRQPGKMVQFLAKSRKTLTWKTTAFAIPNENNEAERSSSHACSNDQGLMPSKNEHNSSDPNGETVDSLLKSEVGPFQGVEHLMNQASLMDKLKAAGTSIIRINCAHGNPEIWSEIMRRVKQSSQMLEAPCRILMDLAGPKLRTNNLQPGPCVVKISPKKNATGNVIFPAQVWLSQKGTGAPPHLSPDTVLYIDNQEFLTAIKVGDTLGFIDARGKKRMLKISRVFHVFSGTGFMAECSRTAYVSSGTELHIKRKKGRFPVGQVVDVPARESFIRLKVGDMLTISRDEYDKSYQDNSYGHTSRAHRIACSSGYLFDAVKPGERIAFDDGKIWGVIKGTSISEIVVSITHAGPRGTKLGSQKSINIPDSNIRYEGLTSKDLVDLEFVASHADMVGVSFVRDTRDIIVLRQELEKRKLQNLGIVLKIETKSGLEKLPLLLLEAMKSSNPLGVMIARGDLAVECGWERLADIQEEILSISSAAHIPVIWATQVLESLVKSGVPTRAEITDVANGRRTSCIMLNKGKHIVQAVSTLNNILNAKSNQIKTEVKPLVLSSHLLYGGAAWNSIIT